MKKGLSLLKKLLKVVVIGIPLLIVGLIINNRLYYAHYCKMPVGEDHLLEKEIKSVENVYDQLKAKTLFQGFDGQQMDLILYNKTYTFLLSSSEEEGNWTYIGEVEALGKHLYRKPKEEEKAFAVKVGERWVGSFATLDYFNASLLEQIPIFMPPQLLQIDESYYEAMIAHEMVHAFEGLKDNERVERDESIHGVNARFIANKEFDQKIGEEAELLQKAAYADSKEESKQYVMSFLSAREKRYKDFEMTAEEIQAEKEMEWLEGSARYVEYHLSRDSKSMVAKHLGDIQEKVKTPSDDRYYTLGMAQIMVLNRLEIDWEEEAFSGGADLTTLLSGVYC